MAKTRRFRTKIQHLIKHRCSSSHLKRVQRTLTMHKLIHHNIHRDTNAPICARWSYEKHNSTFSHKWSPTNTDISVEQRIILQMLNYADSVHMASNQRIPTIHMASRSSYQGRGGTRMGSASSASWRCCSPPSSHYPVLRPLRRRSCTGEAGRSLGEPRRVR